MRLHVPPSLCLNSTMSDIVRGYADARDGRHGRAYLRIGVLSPYCLRGAISADMRGKYGSKRLARCEIEQKDGWNYELRSGSAFELYVNGKWVKTHMEHSDRLGGYYAVGLEGIALLGKLARVCLSY